MRIDCGHRTLLVPPWGDNRRKWDCADCGVAVTPFPKTREHSHTDPIGEGGTWAHSHKDGAYPDHEEAFHRLRGSFR